MFGGVLFPPPPLELGGFGLTRAPDVDPGRKFFGDSFGETTDPLEGGYFGETVLGGNFGEVVGPRTAVDPYPVGLLVVLLMVVDDTTERPGDVSSDLDDSFGI
jgi:hypothetical protein